MESSTAKERSVAPGLALFVEQKVHDEFLDKLVARAKKLQPGDPLDPKTRLGAIVSEQQMKTVLGYIERARGRREPAHGRQSCPALTAAKDFSLSQPFSET